MKFKAVPMLRIFDEAKAKEFYLEFLGMHLDWEHRFEPESPIYMQVSRDDLVLHLTEHSADCTPGAKVFVYSSELDELFKALSSKAYKYNRPGIEVAPWGDRILEVVDPFANKLLFNEQKAT